MPRKYVKRKSATKKTPSRWGIYKRAGNQLWKDVKLLKSIVNVEYKLVESLANSVNMYSGNPQVVLLNGIQRGTDYNQITGRSCKFTSAQIFVKFVKSANEGTTKLNFALVIDKQPNEAAPSSINDIWSDPDSRFRNLDNRKRFVVLKEGHMTCVYGDQQKEATMYKKLNMHTIYDATNGGTIADIRTNALYLLFWCDDPTSGDLGTLKYSYRLRFIDN